MFIMAVCFCFELKPVGQYKIDFLQHSPKGIVI